LEGSRNNLRFVFEEKERHPSVAAIVEMLGVVPVALIPSASNVKYAVSFGPDDMNVNPLTHVFIDVFQYNAASACQAHGDL
jgi:hypothetical protein